MLIWLLISQFGCGLFASIADHNCSVRMGLSYDVVSWSCASSLHRGTLWLVRHLPNAQVGLRLSSSSSFIVAGILRVR